MPERARLADIKYYVVFMNGFSFAGASGLRTPQRGDGCEEECRLGRSALRLARTTPRTTSRTLFRYIRGYIIMWVYHIVRISYYVSIYYICQRSARASQPRAADGIHERALLGGGLRASAPSIVHTLEAGISTSTTQR